jgi:hypothetical protein
MNKCLFFITIAGLLSITPAQAQEAQMPQVVSPQPPRIMRPAIPARICEPTETVNEKLGTDFAEQIIFVGAPSGQPGLLKIYANKKAPSWTMVFSYNNGQSCIFETGSDFEYNSKELE